LEIKVAKGVNLREAGLSLWRGHFENHDFLWFATTDINATASTLPILHNYALTYALCQYSHAAYLGYRPNYDADLDRMNAYALPAQNSLADRSKFTYNAIDDLTQRTDKVMGSEGVLKVARFNTPKLGRRICLTPIGAQIHNANAAPPSRGFDVFVFGWNDFRPPSVFRLGKKGCPIRVWWKEIPNARAEIFDGEISPIHPVNPRDLLHSPSESVVAYYPAFLPPHFLYARATLRREWGIPLGGGRWIHAPARVVHRWLPAHPVHG
jgi:CRISPR type I-D-associated protein Csc1